MMAVGASLLVAIACGFLAAFLEVRLLRQRFALRSAIATTMIVLSGWTTAFVLLLLALKPPGAGGPLQHAMGSIEGEFVFGARLLTVLFLYAGVLFFIGTTIHVLIAAAIPSMRRKSLALPIGAVLMYLLAATTVALNFNWFMPTS